MNAAIPAVNFGSGSDFSLGVEEELLLVDPDTRALAHTATDVLEHLSVPPGEGSAHPEAYAAVIELASPVCTDATDVATSSAALRGRLRDAGATSIGAGLHPTAAFGDVVHFPSERYRRVATEMRGLQARTPTCALHVHVGMPDAETAIRTHNALRMHLPLLQALAANSPFWHAQDSGLASARAQVFRGFPRSEIPPAFASFDDYAERVGALAAAGDFPDYTFLWWDIRPHPILGTVEVRALDSQSSLHSITGIAALVHSLARWAAEQHGPWESRDVLMESSFRAARDGLAATLWHDGQLRPALDVARATLALARPYARELGSEAALEEVERVLADGNGATRQRASFARGGLPAVLGDLAEETVQSEHSVASARGDGRDAP
jgi:carboxylate-amine ligase